MSINDFISRLFMILLMTEKFLKMQFHLILQQKACRREKIIVVE